ncbi:FAD-dependent oxidoreductase [Devosia sp. A369]
MADAIKPDLCVIGAGALGVSLALRARQRGLSVVLVQGATPEGDPVAGSLRRATLLASAERAEAMRSAGQVGLSAVEPKLNFRAITEHADAIAAAAAPRDAAERLAGLGVTMLAGPASFIDRQTLRCGDHTIRARQFALATGATPLIPPLPGLEQVKFFTADSIADNSRKLSHLVVIGGEPAAFELAQAYRRLGAMVTLVPQGGLLPGFDPELVAILLRALREEGVVILDDAEVSAILPRSQGTGIALRRSGGEDSLDVSHILVAMGRVPLLDAELLDKAKLRRDRMRPELLQLGPDGQTSNGRITAIGGAAGEHQPHIGAHQVTLLLERLLRLGPGRLDVQQVPRLVATQPALAQLGGLEAGAKLRPGQTVWRSNLVETETAQASGQPAGTVKLIAAANGAISSAGAVGADAGELAAMLALAMGRGLKLGELAGLALPQPSAAAALVELAEHYLAQQPPRRWPAQLPALLRLRR